MIVDSETSSASESAFESLKEAAAGRPAEVLIVAPALSSRLDRLTGDQSADDSAAIRLHEMIKSFEAMGVPARGHIGSHDPLVAVEEGLREFAADCIVFVTPPDDRSNWLEQGVLANVTDRTDLAVSRVVVDETQLR